MIKTRMLKRLLSLAAALALSACFLPPAAVRAEEDSDPSEEPDLLWCGAFGYLLLEDGTADIRSWAGEGMELTIPSELDGIPVSSVGDGAFWCVDGAEYLCRVTVPAGVKRIGVNAFRSCSALEEITLPEGLEEIGAGAFFQCEDLRQITLPSTVTEIGPSAFALCYQLEGITFPAGVTTLADGMFDECWHLKSFTIPDTVTEIGLNPFSDCKRLEEIVLSPDHPTLEFVGGVLSASRTAASYAIPKPFRRKPTPCRRARRSSARTPFITPRT